jgi:cytochrome c oxidase subunit 2
MRTELIALFLVLLAIAGTPAGVAMYESAARPADEITLVGHTPLHGNWSQREIHVKQGATVRIRLTSEDVTHGFYIPDFNVNAGPIAPGKFKTVEFTADRAGTFTFYCNVLCSHEHGGMTGKIVVE